jgi:hypothetical protein
VDEPGPETTGAKGDGPAATVAMSGATWVAVVVRVCGRCGVVGGLVRDAGGSYCDVGGLERGVGGRDRGSISVYKNGLYIKSQASSDTRNLRGGI